MISFEESNNSNSLQMNDHINDVQMDHNNNNNHSSSDSVNGNKNQLDILKSKIISTHKLITMYKNLQEEYNRIHVLNTQLEQNNNQLLIDIELLQRQKSNPNSSVYSSNTNGNTDISSEDYKSLYLKEKSDTKQLKVILEQVIGGKQPLENKVIELEKEILNDKEIIKVKDLEITNLHSLNKQLYARITDYNKAIDEKDRAQKQLDKFLEFKRLYTEAKKEKDRMTKEIQFLRKRNQSINNNLNNEDTIIKPIVKRRNRISLSSNGSNGQLLSSSDNEFSDLDNALLPSTNENVNNNNNDNSLSQNVNNENVNNNNEEYGGTGFEYNDFNDKIDTTTNDSLDDIEWETPEFNNNTVEEKDIDFNNEPSTLDEFEKNIEELKAKRLLKEKEEQDRLLKEEHDSLLKEEQDRLLKEEQDRLKKEEIRIQFENEEKERLQKEKRIQLEKEEKEKLDKLEKEIREKEKRIQLERKEKEEKEKFDKLERERQEILQREKLLKEKEEKERLDRLQKEIREKEERERLEKEKENNDRIFKIQRELEEKERLNDDVKMLDTNLEDLLDMELPVCKNVNSSIEVVSPPILVNPPVLISVEKVKKPMIPKKSSIAKQSSNVKKKSDILPWAKDIVQEDDIKSTETDSNTDLIKQSNKRKITEIEDKIIEDEQSKLKKYKVDKEIENNTIEKDIPDFDYFGDTGSGDSIMENIFTFDTQPETTPIPISVIENCKSNTDTKVSDKSKVKDKDILPWANKDVNIPEQNNDLISSTKPSSPIKSIPNNSIKRKLSNDRLEKESIISKTIMQTSPILKSPSKPLISTQKKPSKTSTIPSTPTISPPIINPSTPTKVSPFKRNLNLIEEKKEVLTEKFSGNNFIKKIILHEKSFQFAEKISKASWILMGGSPNNWIPLIKSNFFERAIELSKSPTTALPTNFLSLILLKKDIQSKETKNLISLYTLIPNNFELLRIIIDKLYHIILEKKYLDENLLESQIFYLFSIMITICKVKDNYTPIKLLFYTLLTNTTNFCIEYFYICQNIDSNFIIKGRKGSIFINTISEIIYHFNKQEGLKSTKEKHIHNFIQKLLPLTMKSASKNNNLENYINDLLADIDKSLRENQTTVTLTSPFYLELCEKVKSVELVSKFMGWVWSYNNIIANKFWVYVGENENNPPIQKLFVISLGLIGANHNRPNNQQQLSSATNTSNEGLERIKDALKEIISDNDYPLDLKQSCAQSLFYMSCK